jgi:hemoglobin
MEPGRPLPDLATPTEINELVTIFYREIVFDELLEPLFGEVAEVDWVEHIPKLIDYWCWILLGQHPYPGHVTRAHRHLHGLQAIEPKHCDRWFSLWVACIDGRWSGPNADHAKRHAETLMAGMAKRIFGYAWSPPTSDRTGTPGRSG